MIDDPSHGLHPDGERAKHPGIPREGLRAMHGLLDAVMASEPGGDQDVNETSVALAYEGILQSIDDDVFGIGDLVGASTVLLSWLASHLADKSCTEIAAVIGELRAFAQTNAAAE
ncbi:hypothetical protein [Pseudoclavibacter terrae]|uniref:hypothetical protein n=1 Tax=Pseudoclavibacter terrae TaxID=1530195 RepID=UPI00232AAEA0|nr:hypothetical protein [Pseudoclavibacter terrae]